MTKFDLEQFVKLLVSRRSIALKRAFHSSVVTPPVQVNVDG